jgi:ribonuclease D
MFALFIFLLCSILYFKYKGKLTPEEKEYKRQQEKQYILTRLNNVSAVINMDRQKVGNITNANLITDLPGLENACAQLAKGSGPIAIDAERASGYKYSQRAYLIQVHRKDGGLHLIDPIPFKLEDFAPLKEILQSCETIIHASTQDLPCLREIGLNPTTLFDTELGGRIAGMAKVGLGPLTEELLGFRLAKEHSAVDWSIRPLRQDWLIYAALDVDVLLELRDD